MLKTKGQGIGKAKKKKIVSEKTKTCIISNEFENKLAHKLREGWLIQFSKFKTSKFFITVFKRKDAGGRNDFDVKSGRGDSPNEAFVHIFPSGKSGTINEP